MLASRHRYTLRRNSNGRGDEILADLHVAPIYDYFSLTPEGETAPSGTPNLRRWWDRMSERPSVQKTAPALG
jgi:glutathione S-transferase